jgi:predicted transporter
MAVVVLALLSIFQAFTLWQVIGMMPGASIGVVIELALELVFLIAFLAGLGIHTRKRWRKSQDASRFIVAFVVWAVGVYTIAVLLLSLGSLF